MTRDQNDAAELCSILSIIQFDVDELMVGEYDDEVLQEYLLLQIILVKCLVMQSIDSSEDCSTVADGDWQIASK